MGIERKNQCTTEDHLLECLANATALGWDLDRRSEDDLVVAPVVLAAARAERGVPKACLAPTIGDRNMLDRQEWMASLDPMRALGVE